MKKVKTFFTVALLTLLFSGCGGGNSEQTTTTLLEGQTSEVAQGDELLSDGDNTEIEIIHVLDNDTKSVKILSGSATLLRNSYTLTN